MEAMTFYDVAAVLRKLFCVVFFRRLLSAGTSPRKSNSVLQLLPCHA